ncbi:hypothetical protein MMC07_005644, partial [Pseudocyphellaria aurata]|nr:hypothetical protein [Pseudocyphellaria aurata]
GHEQVVKLLLANGAEVNAQDKDGANALQAASAKGHEQVVKLLLANGAEVNAQDKDGANALQAASAEGHEQVVKLLLANGAEVNTQGEYPGNTLQESSTCSNTEATALGNGIMRPAMDALKKNGGNEMPQTNENACSEGA